MLLAEKQKNAVGVLCAERVYAWAASRTQKTRSSTWLSVEPTKPPFNVLTCVPHRQIDREEMWKSQIYRVIVQTRTHDSGS
jgi:hypothetical protein